MNFATDVLLACAAGLTLVWLFAAQRRLVARAARRFAALPRVEQALLVLAVGVMTVCAQKEGTGNKEQEQVTGNKEQGTSAVAEASGSGISHGVTETRSEDAEDSSNKVEAVSRPLQNEEDDVHLRSGQETPRLAAPSGCFAGGYSSTLAADVASLSNPCESVQSVADSQSVQFVKSVAQNLHVTTNEVFDFSPPEGACLATNWLIRGAATDYRRIRIDGEFPFDGIANSNFVVFANGVVYLPQSKKMLKPFSASLGIVPAANWGKIVFNAEILEEGRRGEEEDTSASPSLLNLRVKAPQASTTFHSSQFWHKVQDDGSLLLTWQNALLNREATNPLSFQAELAPSGSITYRYDFSNLASDELLTNAVVAIGEQTVDGVTNRAVTSVTLQAAEERLCDEARERFNEIIGDVDPFSYPAGSTNMVWEHVVYTGTTNAPFAYPTASTDTAILRVTCSGSGDGELIVGERCVALQGTGNREQGTSAVAEASGSDVSHGDTEARSGESGRGLQTASGKDEASAIERRSGVSPLQEEEVNLLTRSGQETASTLSIAASASTNPCQSVKSVAQDSRGNKILIPIPKGVRQNLYLRHDGTLNVSLDSDDFTYGRLPNAGAFRRTGWIVCPQTDVTPACFHSWNYPTKRVSLNGSPENSLTCTWTGTDDVEVENEPPHAATLKGAFSPSDARQVSYALAHLQYLFGQTTFQQTAQYCPKKTDDVDDDLASETNSVPYREETKTVPCWLCYWGLCSGDNCSCDSTVRCTCGKTVGSAETVEPEDPEPGDYEQSKTNAPCLTGVLKIRNPLAYSQSVYLRVPTGSPNCCPCPEHATNCVEMMHCSSRLKVIDEKGADFERTMESTTVRIAAVRPSEEIGDARIHFATNGAVMLTCKYTTLGVGIEGNGVDLNLLNNRNRSFGLPFTMGTNESSWASLRLMTNVRLPTGNIHLGFENATADFELKAWDAEKQCYWTLCRAGEDVDVSLTKWRKLVGGLSDGSSAATQVYVLSPTAGTATLVFRYWGVIDGKFVEDEAKQNLTAVVPPMKADVNHDGKINGDDVALSLARRPFRFWSNEDTDKGDYVGQVADDNRNSDDLVVNGKLDLVNLFPIELDLTKFRQAWGGAATARFFAHSQRLRYCVLAESVSDDVGRLVTTDLQTADGEALEFARLAELGSGRESAFNPWSDSCFYAKPMTFALEATGRTYDDLAVEVCMGEKVVYSYRMPISISSVDGMYRYADMRGAVGNASFVPTVPGEPGNGPDAETDGRHFVFVHGYNVDAAASRRWARAMFKRLWWAGSRSKFTAVDWRGDYSQVDVPGVGEVSVNYYQNVVNAFDTALSLKMLCDGLQGAKVLLAHSLGNMVVSSAVQDHGLSNYSRYYMLNAAVPVEAYDPSAALQVNMVPQVWQCYNERLYSARWSELFGPDDGRGLLSWRGRFAKVTNAVNCYSPTEDVLANAPVSGAGGAWSLQELNKGLLVGAAMSLSLEGGWGFNSSHLMPLSQTELMRTDYTDDELKADPPFRAFDESWLFTTNNVSDAVVLPIRARILGDAIPALSFAAGANAIGCNGIVDMNMQNLAQGAWPKHDQDKDVEVWEHSDVKDVAFPFVYRVFQTIVENEEVAK